MLFFVNSWLGISKGRPTDKDFRIVRYNLSIISVLPYRTTLYCTLGVSWGCTYLK